MAEQNRLEEIIKEDQEQAVAAWINYLNQLRLNKLIDELNKISADETESLQHIQDLLSKAFTEIEEANKTINLNFDRGGEKGRKGFFAEIAEVGVGKAWAIFLEKAKSYIWLNDNGQFDIRINGIDYQMKFVEKDMSLEACMKHLDKYPDSLRIGGRYMIPKDHYEKIIFYMKTPEDVANKMGTETGEFSLKEWKFVHGTINEEHLPLSKIRPSSFTFSEVKAGNIEKTLEKEKIKLSEEARAQSEIINQKALGQRDEAYLKSKPSLSEATKSTILSAGIEGLTTLVLKIVKKIKSGKKLSEFNEVDWNEIFKDTGISTLKGGIRGGTIYVLTNYTATPASVASSLVTASFGIAEQIHLFRVGELDETSLIENSEIICLDSAISATFSLAGQALIPIPVIGAVIGNTVGNIIYNSSKEYLSEKELNVLNEYLADIEVLEKQLDEEYKVYAEEISKNVTIYMNLLKNAFYIDSKKAFEGSALLAEYIGVSSERILSTSKDVEEYFLS